MGDVLVYDVDRQPDTAGCGSGGVWRYLVAVEQVSARNHAKSGPDGKMDR